MKVGQCGQILLLRVRSASCLVENVTPELLLILSSKAVAQTSFLFPAQSFISAHNHFHWPSLTLLVLFKTH